MKPRVSAQARNPSTTDEFSGRLWGSAEHNAMVVVACVRKHSQYCDRAQFQGTLEMC